jgi:histidine triad (HIT) family protein
VKSKPDCIFCQIVHKTAPAHVVCEDERTLVFMDLFPVAHGHTLIIPKAHCDDLFDSDPDDLRAVMDASHRVAQAIDRVLTPAGLGVYQLNRAPAGQTVFHYHMHLIPRQLGEGLLIHSRVRGDPARLAEVAKQLGDAVAAS